MMKKPIKPKRNFEKQTSGAFGCVFAASLFLSSVIFPAVSSAEVIFQDGFESGNIITGDWTYSGALSVNGPANSGNYAAKIDDSGYLMQAISTVGFDAISLEYARYTYAYDSGEQLTVQWSTDGSTWNTIETYTGSWQKNIVQLGSDAAQQPTLYIRFSSNANGSYERFRIDDVVVNGTSAATGNQPPKFIGGSIGTSDAQADSSYSDTLSDMATDPNSGDLLTFSKVSGPDWLNIETDGTLTGIPDGEDTGENNFFVEVSDGELVASAILVINVQGDGQASYGQGDGQTSCLPEVTDFRNAGPFDISTDQSGQVKMFIPKNLPAGCRVPIIHLANGTGAPCFTYDATLRHFASHGFISACYDSTETGQGDQAITAIKSVIEKYPNMVDNRYGFTGHSQGGGGAIMGVYRAEQEWGSSAIYAGFAIEPASGFGDSPLNWGSLYGQIYSPVSMFNGSRDMLVSSSWVRSAYDALDRNLEKAWYEAVGAGHMSPIPNSQASEFGLAWFRWQLLGDSQACKYFKDMPNAFGWTLKEVDNLSSCN